MQPEVIWTDLTPGQIRDALADQHLHVGEQVVGEPLDREGYRPRQIREDLAMGSHRDRDARLRNIARIKRQYLGSPDPIPSIDTKKRELLGTFYRDGRVYARRPLLAYDHDFPSFADGVVIPHGMYDLKRNAGYVGVGTSHDTSEFACGSITWWWAEHGRRLYPDARSIGPPCDGGGSTSSSRYLFKEDLRRLADRLGVEIRVAHYPPYCSKFNPIERRLFPHLTRACQGVLFDGVATVARLLEKARTATGLSVVVKVMEEVYQVGRKYAEGFKENMKIVFDDHLPAWNYRAVPTDP